MLFFLMGSFLRGRVGSKQHTLSGLLVKKKSFEFGSELWKLGSIKYLN